MAYCIPSWWNSFLSFTMDIVRACSGACADPLLESLHSARASAMKQSASRIAHSFINQSAHHSPLSSLPHAAFTGHERILGRPLAILSPRSLQIPRNPSKSLKIPLIPSQSEPGQIEPISSHIAPSHAMSCILYHTLTPLRSVLFCTFVFTCRTLALPSPISISHLHALRRPSSLCFVSRCLGRGH